MKGIPFISNEQFKKFRIKLANYEVIFTDKVEYSENFVTVNLSDKIRKIPYGAILYIDERT